MSTNTKTETHIRWMIRRDMDDVLRIENDSFGFSWTEDEFIDCLRQRNCIGMVAENRDKLVGFMIYELHKSRLHILNFAVDRCHRHQGVGTAMINKLKSKLSRERRDRIMLEVNDMNLNAQLFFRSQGFKAISVLREYYKRPICDAYLMQYLHEAENEA